MKLRFALAFLPLLILFANGSAQTPDTLLQKYGPPDEKGRYAVRRNVGLEPVFDAGGQLVSATVRVIDDGTNPNSSPMQEPVRIAGRVALEILDEIAPISQRGNRVGFRILEHGRFSQETTEYENVTTILESIGDPRNGGSTMSIKVTWKKRSQNAKGETPAIKAVVDLLPAENGVVPVEIQQVQVDATKPEEIEGVSYVVRNNTNKGITALGVARSTTYEEGGNSETATNSDTVDLIWTTDFSDSTRKRKIAPGEVQAMESGRSITFGGGTIIQAVHLKVDYVEFDDGSSLGAASSSAQQVKAMRDGVTRYKAWLVGQYVQSKKSMDTVLILLQKDDLPDELSPGSAGEKLGAQSYRGHLLKIYQTEGAAKVETFLTH